MLEKTHRFITKKSLELLADPIFHFFKEPLIDASADEDVYRLGTWKIPNLGLGHFYNPHATLFKRQFWSIFGTAKSRGMKWYAHAEKLLKEEKFFDGFYALGRALHFLQDLASPSHVHIYAHYLSKDGFENYVENNLGELEKIIQEQQRSLHVIQLSHYKYYFDQLAFETCRFEPEKTNNLRGKIFGWLNRYQKLEEIKLKEQAEVLIPSAIQYTAGFLKFFSKNNVLLTPLRNVDASIN